MFNYFQDCPKNVCLPIYPNICSDDFNNCKNVSQNDTRLKVTCNYDIRNNVNDCKNLVTKLHYNFYHNGTKGYNRVETLAVLANISYEFGMQDFEVHQEYSINFWWINQTRNFSKMLSGNPGYLIGKPILTGNLVNVGNKTNVVLKIERFSESYVRSFITLPDNVNGNCVLKNETYLSVDFGYNLLTKCRFNSTIFNRKKYLNGTEVCRNIQRAILKLWGGNRGK
ncbi:hypothetical protein NQ318_004100 [Aromia moschata]|uniref:Uncharacterized protein n=1 Tax=Aromia moschata TaxID=1265417 RepID=A0AAV8XUQ0_9CUCU|nr:hypothetical protein NQ318_004100 [Aromia moschata]